MTVSEASVGDVIVLTYDVTACMCVHVHASVLVCVPVRVTFCVFLFFLGMLNLIIIYFSSFFGPNLGYVFSTRVTACSYQAVMTCSKPVVLLKIHFFKGTSFS